MVLYGLACSHWGKEKKGHLGALCTCRVVNSSRSPGQTASQGTALPSCFLWAVLPDSRGGRMAFGKLLKRSPHTHHPRVTVFCTRGAAEGLRPRGTRTAKQRLLLCLPRRNLLSGGNNMVLSKKLLLFPIKQKLLPINHLIPELCSSISVSQLLSLHLLLTILATHMSFNAVSLQNGFLIK